MDKDTQDSQYLLKAMDMYSYDVEIEASIAENIGISREEYNKIIESGRDSELPDCIKTYRGNNQIKQRYEETLMESALREQITNEISKNKYVVEMIQDGILSKDGKTPLTNLDDVACYLVKKNQKVTMKVLIDLGLQKSDGKPYSKSAYTRALFLANTK
jgi:hypothetical protein